MSPDTSDPERPADRSGGPADPPRDDPAPAAPPLSYATPVTARPARGIRRALGLTLGVALLVTALGAPLGLLWAGVAPDTPVVKTPEGAIYGSTQPEQPIAADGWFSLLGLGFGVLTALALWFLLRRRRGPVGLFAGVLGGLGAAAVAWQVGRRIGLATYQRLLETAPDGRAFTKPADLRAGGVDWLLGVLPVPHGNLLVPAFGVAVTYTLLAGWSRWPSLRPEAEFDAAWPPVGAGGLGAGGLGATGPGGGELGVGGLSWGPADRPARSAAPEPPGPDAAEPPRG